MTGTPDDYISTDCPLMVPPDEAIEVQLDELYKLFDMYKAFRSAAKGILSDESIKTFNEYVIEAIAEKHNELKPYASFKWE